jgi:hypothetical protein
LIIIWEGKGGEGRGGEGRGAGGRSCSNSRVHIYLSQIVMCVWDMSICPFETCFI